MTARPANDRIQNRVRRVEEVGTKMVSAIADLWEPTGVDLDSCGVEGYPTIEEE